MSADRVCFALALLLTACGGGSPAAEPAPPADLGAGSSGSEAAESSCPFTAAAIARTPLSGVGGMRLRARLPPGFVHLVGLPTLSHPCGVVVTFGETPMLPSEEERNAFSSGMMRGFVENGRRRCSQVAEDTFACEPDGGVLRWVEAGDVRGFVYVVGPPDIARAIAASATGDAGAMWAPSKAMRIEVAPIPGLELDPLSAPPHLRFAMPGDERPDGPRLQWTFVPYNAHPDHADGSPWTDREVGEHVGRAMATELGLQDARVDGASLVRQTALGQDLELEVDATVAGQPVRGYGAYLRENIGFFRIVGRAPAAEAAGWLERYRGQVRSYRVTD